jgi:hypothetical protein
LTLDKTAAVDARSSVAVVVVQQESACRMSLKKRLNAKLKLNAEDEAKC